MVKKNSGIEKSSHKQSKARGFVASVSRQVDDFPLEVSMLIDVFSRIEARRQARLRTIGRE